MSAELKIDDRCHYTYADGRRCRMLRANDHPSLCLQHLRQQLQPQPDPGAVAAELLGLIEDFSTAAAVNKALGKLFAMVAGDRIPPRNAALLVYICQLLLTPFPPWRMKSPPRRATPAGSTCCVGPCITCAVPSRPAWGMQLSNASSKLIATPSAPRAR